mgnify:FL=1
MTTSRPLILITNDDGVEAPGLHRLIETASAVGDVVAVAPSLPQSGMSSAITVNAALFIKEHPGYDGARVYSVNGKPVDCVKLALKALTGRKPDLLLSGINHGSNAGNSVVYSGTMGAAAEGCMAGIPSIGFSLTHHSIKADFGPGLPYVDKIMRDVLVNGLPEGICLNVNIPARCEPCGIKVTKAARGYWTEEYQEYTSPHGQPFYWLQGNFVNIDEGDTDTDEYWLDRQYVTVVPYRPEHNEPQSVRQSIAGMLGLS